MANDRRLTDRNGCPCGVTHGLESCPVLKRVREVLGDDARIGRNPHYDDVFVGTYVGGEWKSFGAGKTWDEALANVKKVKFQKGNGQFVFEEEEKP